MPTYGDELEPGITTDIASAYNVSTSGDAPSDLGIVGQADLDNGSASADELHEVTRATQARNLFGDEADSLLTSAIIDALTEGAFPVYAVATAETDETGEDISGVGGTSGSFDNAPVSENPDDITITVDGTVLTPLHTYEDPSTKSPAADEVYYNGPMGTFELGTAPSDGDTGNDTADYTHYDYTSAIDAMESKGAEEIDFLVALCENSTVADHVVTTAEAMDDNYNFALALVAPGDTDIDPSTYTQGRDTSRAQEVYGTRFEDGTSLLAAYAAKRAALGLDRPAVNVSLESTKRMADFQADKLDKSGRSDLIDERVVPIADEAGGVRIVDDPTTVDPQGTKNDRNIDFGFTRLLMDYVTDTTRENEKPFIGRLNNASVRNTFKDLVAEELTALQDSGSVLSYTLNVEEDTATKALLEISVEVAKPLRFIHNDVTVGESA